MRKIWSTPGGIHPKENKIQSLHRPLGDVPLASRYIVPIQRQSKAIVQCGQAVLKGQPLTEITGFMGVIAHAPTSGVVLSIDNQPIVHPSGLDAPCVVIQADGEDNSVDFTPADPAQLSNEQILQRIRQAGICGMGGAGFPTAIKVAPNRNKPINTLIINAVECEPYITADDILMRSYPTEIVQGIRILAQLLGQPDDIVIGIENNKKEAISALRTQLSTETIELAEFPPKYPSGGEKQLIQILTGKEVPSGKLPSDLGILCQNVGTVYAIYQAVCLGRPLISRITTVTGNGCANQQNLAVPIGTPIAHLLAQCGFNPKSAIQVIMGGPMMGLAIQNLNAPIVKTSNCILTPDRQELPKNDLAMACIRCGMCAEVCPSSLLPQQLLWHAQEKNIERLQAHNLFDCIECGACSYVCPSKIPLVQYYRAAKGEIRQMEKDKIHSDRARERFEYNKLRKEQQEKEKLAKREARRIAAQQAKAEQQSNPAPSSSTKSDVVQAALAQVTARQASPEQQRAKLQRAVKSCSGRLERTRQKLLDAADESVEKRAALQALIDTAQLKLDEAKQQLAGANISPLKQDLDRVSEKITASPRQTLATRLDKINAKIDTIDEKIAQCNDPDLLNILQTSRQKFIGKRTDAENDIEALGDEDDKPVADQATLSATERAIAKAKMRLDNNETAETVNPAERLRSRLAKAQQRLAEAEQQNTPNNDDPNKSSQIDALRKSIVRLQQKLAELE